MIVFIAARPIEWECVEVLGIFSSMEKAQDAAKKANKGTWEVFERELDVPVPVESSDVPSGFTT